MKKFIFSLIAGMIALFSVSQDVTGPELQIYGQLMTDGGYNFNQVNPDYWDVMRPTQLPSYKNEYGSDGNVFFSVRQSMLGFRFFLPTPQGELKAKFAFDMFGMGPNEGQTTFHMLYAYIEWWKIGVGWTWSQFCDHDIWPATVEYWGPNGMSLCKNIIVSFIPLQGANRLAIALERPGASADQGIYADRIELTDVAPKLSLPDLTAEFRMTRNWGYVKLAGVIKRLKWVDLGNEPYDLSGQAMGWGFNLSSNLKIGKKDVFKGGFIFGKAIQNLINDAPTDIAIKNTFDNPDAPVKGVALPVITFSAYLDHHWSSKFSSAIGCSAIFTDNTDGQAADAFRQGYYASTNLIYYPVPNLMAALEVLWIRRTNYNDGWATNATKIQVSFKYDFSIFMAKPEK